MYGFEILKKNSWIFFFDFSWIFLIFRIFRIFLGIFFLFFLNFFNFSDFSNFFGIFFLFFLNFLNCSDFSNFLGFFFFIFLGFFEFFGFSEIFFGVRRFYKWKRIQTLNLKIWNPQKKILGFFGFFLGSVRGFLWVNNPSGISSLHTTRPVFRPTSPGRRVPVEKWWPSAD